MTQKYCNSLTKYSRRKSIEVSIGDVPLGGDNPIRIQSMTTVDTMDTEETVEQALRMVESGCEYVRITAPSIKEAKNLQPIKDELRLRGCNVPLVADIHFTPNAAEVAARIVEKVRINPGNYADKKRFENIEYTDEGYEKELIRIRQKFTPLVEICKEHGTAMRIGTNHGSLSDRILSRYGDTPLGMVESALEFLRICEDHDYHNIVLSMKASNTRVMVQAYRLLVNKLEEEGMRPYPLHLGVTEAGEGEDGRIKSAVGIGTLLEDGLGDTVRVSLTEDPEFEAPVAKVLVDRYDLRAGHNHIESISNYPIHPFDYKRRDSAEVMNFGSQNVPRVIADLSKVSLKNYKDLQSIGHYYLSEPDKWTMTDQGADYVYTGASPADFMLPNGLKQIVDSEFWDENDSTYPLFRLDTFQNSTSKHQSLNFIGITASELVSNDISCLGDETIVLILESANSHAMADMRRAVVKLMELEIRCPIVMSANYTETNISNFQLHLATDIGALLIDGLGDGVMAAASGVNQRIVNSAAFGVLQAARTRMSKTEYISCPSCGRTLFDLQETTAMIRKRTDHLKGVKIGIMGCIVNGPGEMADADYGYVGTGIGKITLYKGQEVVKRSVTSDTAVEELIAIIKDHGDWVEPESVSLDTHE